MIAPKVEISLSTVELGDYVNIAHHAQISYASIGKRTSIGRYTKVQYAHIGAYCSISWDVTIGAVEHLYGRISTHAFTYRKQFGLCEQDGAIEHRYVEIGNDVWIGCNAIIMPGVIIGNGAIIGAGAVVTRDVEPYEIVGGVPARHMKYRFEKEYREDLNCSGWWELEDSVIKENFLLFQQDIRDNFEVMMQLKKLVLKNDKAKRGNI